MKQVTYKVEEEDAFRIFLEGLSRESFYLEAQSILVQAYSSIMEPSFIEKMVDIVRGAMPTAQVAGLTTCGEIANGIKERLSLVLSFCFFESSDIYVEEYDCTSVSVELVGKRIQDKTSSLENVVGIQLFGTATNITMDSVISPIASFDNRISIFGAGAGTVNPSYGDMFVFGNKTYHKGIVAVIFVGKELEISVDYNLGWIPMGKEMTITKTDGRLCVETIDDMPATQIYKRYLNVVPNEYFVKNTCEFPATIKRDGLLVARTPLSYDEEGRLFYSSDISEGEKMRLSYGNSNNILEEVYKNSVSMVDFEPQALFLCACFIRENFLKQEEKLEVEYYKEALSSVCGGYVYAEILRSKSGGGVLNSALIAVGLREGKKSQGEKRRKHRVELPNQGERSENVIPFSERLIIFLEAITSELVETNKKLEKLATMDGLTQIYNRRGIEQIFESEIAKSSYPGNLSILIFDIDDFKKINDSFGHDIGDYVLKKVVKSVKKVLREQDSFGRWGGEEFLCVLPEVSMEDALLIAEWVRESVAKTEFKEAGEVSISVGITTTHPNDTKDSIYRRVDQALFDAKSAGKNKVCSR